MKTVKHLIALATTQLKLSSMTAQLDAEILLAFALDKNRTWLKTWPEKEPTSDQFQKFHQLLERRKQGEPIAYIMGEQAFWSFDLKVTTDTLIPRPETELLVETILDLQDSDVELTCLDLGTGTGAIALAIACERPSWLVHACDQSPGALVIAKENQRRLGFKVLFEQSDWFTAYQDQSFDIIVSNPPYIEADDFHLSQGDVRFEPMSALASGKDGLDDIRLITSNALPRLNAGGVLMFEHGYNQGEAVRSIMDAAGFTNVQTSCDLNGHERITWGYSENISC